MNVVRARRHGFEAAAIAALTVAALGVTTGSATATTAHSPAGVTWSTSMVGSGVYLHTSAGGLSEEHHHLVVRNPAGTLVDSVPLAIDINGSAYPVRAAIKGNDAVLAADTSVAPIPVPVHKADLSTAVAGVKDPITLSAAVGGFIGAATGLISGCVLGGFLGGAPAAAGAVPGAALVGSTGFFATLLPALTSGLTTLNTNIVNPVLTPITSAVNSAIAAIPGAAAIVGTIAPLSVATVAGASVGCLVGAVALGAPGSLAGTAIGGIGAAVANAGNFITLYNQPPKSSAPAKPAQAPAPAAHKK